MRRPAIALALVLAACGGGDATLSDGGAEPGFLAPARAYQQRCAPDAGAALSTLATCWGRFRPDFAQA